MKAWSGTWNLGAVMDMFGAIFMIPMGFLGYVLGSIYHGFAGGWIASTKSMEEEWVKVKGARRG